MPKKQLTSEEVEILKRDIARLEKQQSLVKERAMLMKKKKQLQFQTTTFGKVTKGAVGIFEKLTRPKPKTKAQQTRKAVLKTKMKKKVKPAKPVDMDAFINSLPQ